MLLTRLIQAIMNTQGTLIAEGPGLRVAILSTHRLIIEGANCLARGALFPFKGATVNGSKTNWKELKEDDIN